MIFGFSYTTWAHQCLKKQVKSPSSVSHPELDLDPPFGSNRGSGRNIILLPFTLYFVPFFCIYIGISILCNIHIHSIRKHSFLISLQMVSEPWVKFLPCSLFRQLTFRLPPSPVDLFFSDRPCHTPIPGLTRKADPNRV